MVPFVKTTESDFVTGTSVILTLPGAIERARIKAEIQADANGAKVKSGE